MRSNNMTINNAYANAAVERTNNFFSISHDDNIAKKGAKATARAIVNTANLVAAAVEMIFSALATAVLSPSALTRFNSAVKTTANHTKDSAIAMKNAAKGIVGISSKKEVEVTAEPKATLTAKNAAAALALTAAAAGIYYGGSALLNYLYSSEKLGASSFEIINRFASATKANVTFDNAHRAAELIESGSNNITSMQVAQALRA